jgi:hypothetical protein
MLLCIPGFHQKVVSNSGDVLQRKERVH